MRIISRSNLTPYQVKHIGHLARIELSDAEAEKLQEDLTAALDYVKVLDELNLQKFEPTAQVTGLQNIERDDEKSESVALTTEEALQNAPRKRKGMFEVPRVV